MADTVKISALTEIASGALDDNSVIPVVDGGSTQKLPVSKLKTFIADSFATDSELSNQISIVNSTIDGLDTGDISEGSNLYYTDTRVKNKLNSEGVISGSEQVTITYDDLTGVPAGIISSSTQVSESAAAAGFGSGTANLGGSNVVSSSAQISDFATFVENSLTSSMTVLSASYSTTASYALNAAGGSGNDYISNVSLSSTTLTFTGTGNAFNSTVDFAGSDVLTLGDGNYLDYNDWLITSESIYNQFQNVSAGAVPAGTVSSSIQVLGGSTVISSSNQIAELGAGILSSSAQIDFSAVSTDDIPEGVSNLYYSQSLVKSYLDQLGVVSGSQSADWNTLANKPAEIVSGAQQIEDFGFTSLTKFHQATQSLEQDILNIDGVDAGNVNFWGDTQYFQDVRITGSVFVDNGSFSGSGANLFNIPGSSIVGAITGVTQLNSGNNFIIVEEGSGVTIDAGNTGSVNVDAGNGFKLRTGSFSGSGANLYGIPGDAIIGGVGSGTGDRIQSGSVTASITSDGVFDVNGPSNFDGNMVVSGSITADEISVGTTGTPTLYSTTNINLSSSNAVVVTSSPLRLTPLSNSQTSSFSLTNGDLVYSSDSDDFYGYKSGSWVSLTQAGTGGTSADGIISSSTQIAELGAGIVSSSAQVVSENSIQNTEILIVENGDITGSSNFAYNIGDNILSVGEVSATDLTYTGTLSGPAGSTGSFSRLLGDSLRINNAVEFPTSDGTTNQVLKTDGAGNVTFANVETLMTTEDITSTGTITYSTASFDTGSIGVLTVDGTINGQQFSAGNFVVESNNIRLQSGGQLMLSSSNESLGVVIDDVLVLPQRDTFPATPRTGSIIVSASSIGEPRPFFFDGTAWTQMFA